jgi:CheY-like chemotaxis protein
MPVMDGWEFMEEMEKLKPLLNKHIVYLVSSSSIAIEDKINQKISFNFRLFI